MNLWTRSLTFSTVLSLALSIAGVESAEAGDRGKAARVRSGGSGSIQKQVIRTGADGYSRSWQKDASWKSGGGSAERDTTWTGPQGGTASRSDSVVRTDSGHERSTTWTDREGRQSTRDAEVTRDPETGTRTKDVTFTGRDGETRTRTSVTEKTDDGRTSTTDISRRDGSSVTWDREVARD